LLVHQKRGTVYVLPKIHRDWHEFDFEGIVVEGGFEVGAVVKEHEIQGVTIRSKFGGPLRLAHGMGEQYMINGAKAEGSILEREFNEGEEIKLTRVLE